ncbi:MAG TPA: hypothetical protein VG895_03445 [Patescibacteria group bacterium]|nr:hypothetical protein [Patescibacteria group bacterium]
MENNSSSNIVKPVKSSNIMPMMIGGAIIIIIVGLAVGFLVSKKNAKTPNPNTKNSSVTVSPTEAGITDVSKYDSNKMPTGILMTGGIKGEGTYHLDSGNGPQHMVYLNSITVDMSQFVGKKVKVWGDTLSAHYAPWLMDVVRIQVVQ